MNHDSSLVSRQGPSGTIRSLHMRRHSLSRSLAKGGRRMSGWVAKVYSSSPRRLPPPTPLPPLPPRYPQNHRLSLLSFSTPTLSVHLLPTPPPSPPVSVSSLVTEFTKFEMDKTRKTNGVGDMNEGSYVPTRVDLISSMIPTTPEPAAKSSRRFPALQSPTLCPSFGRTQTPPIPDMDGPALLPTPPESHAGSRHSTPPMPYGELGGRFQSPAPARPQTAQTATSSYIPAASTSQNYSRTPRRSMSANLADSFTLISRRRRTTNPAIPSIPPLTLVMPPTINTSPPSKPNVLRRRSTTSPTAPPIPPRHPRGLEVPSTVQRIAAPQLLPELSFSTSPLMPSPLPAGPSSPLRKGGLRSPGSPVRTGAVRNLRIERRSVLLQPSAREDRELTKANTERLQLQSKEVETVADELHNKFAQTEVDSNGEGWKSLDGVLSNMEPRAPISPERTFPTRSSSLLHGTVTPDMVSRLKTPPHFQIARAAPRQAVLVHIGRRAPGSFTSTPVKNHEAFESHKVITGSKPVTSTRTIDIEVAFSSLGGFGSGGIWRKIGVYLEQWDLARLARVSKRVKRAIEPLLYETISLRPNLPQDYSFSYLSRLLKTLNNKANKSKLRKWTRNFRIENGFELNQTLLMDGDTFLEEEAVYGPNGKVMISKERISELIEDEGLEGEGGVESLSRCLSDVLEHTSNLSTFSLDSAVPMDNNALIPLSGTMSLNTLKLNLSQPMRKKRQGNRTKTPAWVALPKYRPNINFLGCLGLVELRLNNLPTRGGTYWKQVWGTVISLSDTLRVLELEMPHIDQTRYGQLFDCYHRVSNLSHFKDDVKTPPVLDWETYKLARSSMPELCNKKLQLHTLELTGFIVDTEIINHEIEPGCLKKLVLIGCMECRGFEFTEDCWKGLEAFRSSGLGFIEMAIEALFTIPCEERKELAFLTDARESCKLNPLGKLRTVVMNAFPKYGHKIEKLGLKEQWKLNTDELNKIFADVHNGGEGFTEIAIALVNTPAAWRVFLNGLKRCKNIRRVQVLNGFFQDENSGYRGNVQDGGARRRVHDDALAIAETFFAAHTEGLPIQLNGIIIAINQCVWRVQWKNNKWGIVRLRGLLKRSAVGCDELQFA